MLAKKLRAQKPPTESVLAILRKGPKSLEEIAQPLNTSPAVVEAAIAELATAGYLVRQQGTHWHLDKTPPPAPQFQYLSKPDGSYLFGFISDTHLGSKYERLDVLRDLYRRFEDAGVSRVFHAGNWIDGEAPFNRHDLHVYGMDNQIEYLAEQYPQGIPTYAVTGDDHEGWYSAREGIDVGRHCENIMRSLGRQDWHNLGYMESYVSLTHARTKKTSQLLVMHPGGGSAYARSYKPQKIVEGFSGGEKPACLLIGHYHKLSLDPIRNVWAIQVGCTQDQTPFLRKRGIEVNVGGGICQLEQDPGTGAIISCWVKFTQYFNAGYYNNRYSRSRPVTLPKATPNG